jgi:hypothetical protein
MEHPGTFLDGKQRAGGTLLLVLGFGVAGLLMAHHPMFFSKFQRIQTDLKDSRLNHYILEHGYLWLRGAPGHTAFWNMPFFHPVPNTAAYSDILLSVGPVYWLWRFGGATPELAFGWWMISVSLLNYAAGILLFRKGLQLDWLPTSAAAFLVAFGAPRLNQIEHQQLLPCFYLLLASYALAWLFSNLFAPWWQRGTYWLLAVTGSVLQLYNGFYLAWFFMAGLGFAAVAGLLLRSSRGIMLDLVKRDRWAILGACGVGLIVLAPLVQHYLPVARQVALHQYLPMYRALTPYPLSWLNLGENHWLWGWTLHREPFRSIGFPPEQWLGIGLLTSMACAAGLYLGRQQPICRVAAAVAIAMALATTRLPSKMLTLLASAVCFFSMAGLYHESDCSGDRSLGLVFLIALLSIIPFPNPYLLALGVMGMVLCTLEIIRTRGELEFQVLPGIALLALCVRFFSIEVLFTGILLAAPLAAVAAYYRRGLREEVVLGFLILVSFFPAVITLLDQPKVLAGVLVAAPISLAATAPRRFRPPCRLMLRALLVCVPLVFIYHSDDCLWLMIYDKLPGGVGIRAVGRIVLILLIPAALGLAVLVQWLVRRRRYIAAAIVCVTCTLEQGVTTKSFDAAASRRTIAHLAQQVDPSRPAFYYHPCPDPDFFRTQLDAMWASLATGVPTINGYSGYFPPDWSGFFTGGFDKLIEPREVLDNWERGRQLSRDQVQWIGSERRCP